MINKKNIIALIPARGGSKGLLQKNILPLNGKPLIAYSIELALKSKYIDRVIVSTDNEEIKQVALEYGAEVPFMRPDEIAQDSTRDLPVFEHCIDSIGDSVDILVHLRPTCPIRKIETVDAALEKFVSELKNGFTSLRGVSVPRDNPFKMWTIEGERLVPLVNLEGIDEPYNTPRQELPLVYWQNGYIDITTAETIEKYKSMTGPSICSFIVNETVFDIDYREALEATENFLQSGEKNEILDQHFPG
jgi:CMP-N,N'-diacetyllegionaminic acid synthase